ncbi:MAG: hopanoid biosynthesis-associated protein HpnK [Candidatus Eremiobacteraeota bacterium]|nr:hopanoid biosynthesis-associated protein HpnK [Candidatus Eremiobacteraeota bacterium]
MKPQRRLIVTADDFGFSPAVNEAVERGHREGVLTTASLMVGAPAAADAIARARTLPALSVGLHVVVVNGRPVLPPERVPALVDSSGAFSADLGRAGVRYFFSRRARRQLEAEIRAQFEAFAASGLRLDHANAHNHMHVHPTVLSTIVEVGRAFGLRGVRLPREPFAPPTLRAATNAAFLAPWLRLMDVRLRRAGLKFNDYVIGLNDTGAMDAERIVRLLEKLPPGVTELYLHPQVGNAEFEALLDPAVKRAIDAL